MLNTINIALSGLTAATKKVNATASNVANVTTAGSLEEGKQKPYDALTIRQTALSDSHGNGAGVKSDIISAGKPFVPSYDPDSPFANEEGIIGTPNIDLAEEAVNLSLAENTYKANIATFKVVDELTEELLSIFDDEV